MHMKSGSEAEHTQTYSEKGGKRQYEKEYTKDYPLTSDVKCQIPIEKAEMISKTKMTGQQIVDMVHEGCRISDIENVKDLIGLLTPYIKNEPHVTDAMEYPKLTVAVGVHAEDWAVCDAGHVTPTVINDTCHTCSNVGEIQWVARSDVFSFNTHKSGQNMRGWGKSTRGVTVFSSHAEVQKQTDYVNTYFTPRVDQVANQMGRGRGRFQGRWSLENRRRPFGQTQYRGNLHHADRPDRDESDFEYKNTPPHRQHNSYQSHREVVSSEVNRYRGHGNMPPRQRGSRQGAENTASSLADSIRESVFHFRPRSSQENASDRDNNQRANYRGRNRRRGSRRGGRNR